MKENESAVNNAVTHHITRLTRAPRLWVAFSGGVDSSVLLHALITTSSLAEKVHIIHVNHQLSETSASWATHCEAVALRYHRPFTLKTLTTAPKPSQSVEAWAREARYLALASVMGVNDVVLTAHHEQDQAETLLLQLFRGAGPKGLSSMPYSTPFSVGCLIRPLLTVSKISINRYAKAHALPYIIDSSNEDIRYHRNYVRQQVLPKIKNRYPAADRTLSRAAKHLQEQSQLLDMLLIEKYHSCLDNANNRLHLISIKREHPFIQKYMFRQFFQACTGFYPSETQLNESIRVFIGAAKDRLPSMHLGCCVFRRYDGWLYCGDSKTHSLPDSPMYWSGELPINCVGLEQPLTRSFLQENGINVNTLDWGRVSIRYRGGGERCRLRGQAHTKPLKKIFQNANIPPWMRPYVPLLYEGETLIFIIGIGACERDKNKENTHAESIS